MSGGAGVPNEEVRSTGTGCPDESDDSDEEGSSKSVWGDHEAAWRYLLESHNSGNEPVFFDHLHMAHDGGISLITGTKDNTTDRLWGWSRYFSAAVVYVSCFLNTFYVIDVCHRVLRTAPGGPLYEKKGYLITEEVLHWISRMLGRGALDSFKTLSVLEFAMLAYLWLCLFYSACGAYLNSGFKRWHYIRSIFFEQLGMLSIFSAMQLLFFVTPKIFVADVSATLFGVESRDYCKAVRIVCFGVVCFVIGFDAFLIKFRQAAQHFIFEKEDLTLDRFYGAAMFLNQLLGVVQLDWIVRRRVYRFVFQGPHSTFTDKAMVKMDVWNAWVAKAIWDKYVKVIDGVAMLTTFSDDDVQAVVLSTTTEELACRPPLLDMPARRSEDLV